MDFYDKHASLSMQQYYHCWTKQEAYGGLEKIKIIMTFFFKVHYSTTTGLNVLYKH